MEVIVTSESVTAYGKTVAHNEHPWRVATNRHTNTDGSSWGWIDQAPGNVCWSNSGAFNRNAAEAIVGAHNRWLEDQQPLSIKLIKAKRTCDLAQAELDVLNARAADARAKLDAAKQHLESLSD